MNALRAEVHPRPEYRTRREVVNASPLRSPSTIDALEPLRVSAVLADVDATQQISLSQLWRALAQGEHGIVDGFFSRERCYLLLSSTKRASSTRVTGRRLAILEAVLSGTRQKSIAIDMVLAPSTVALNSRLALEGLGVNCTPSRAHPLLMLAAKASREALGSTASYSTFVARDGSALTVVAADRPDRFLERMLPAAELEVIRNLVEGRSYAEIAHARGTSTRTVANQITAVFRRLRLSGRNELVQRLFFERRLGSALPERIVNETIVPPAARAAADPAAPEARRSA